MPPDLQSQLERFLDERLPDADGVRVLALERNMEGFSQECFSFDAELRRGERRELRSYVLKREPLTGLLEPYDLEPEFKVLHALSDQALLSPPTPWFSDDPALLERPFYVMEKLSGEVPLPVEGPDGDGPFSEGQRRALAPQVTQTLAKLHAVGWREHGLGFLGAPEPGRAAAERELARWEERIERAGFPMAPVLAESLAWLRANVPATDEITLVHGDYRLGNFLVELEPDEAKLTGILDWEMVHLGDPLEDLAWCSSPLWRGGTPNVGTMLSPEEFADAYAAASKRAIDPARMAFYETLSVVKMSAIMLTGIRGFQDGRTDELRMAVFDHQLPFLHALLAVSRGWLSGV